MRKSTKRQFTSLLLALAMALSLAPTAALLPQTPLTMTLQDSGGQELLGGTETDYAVTLEPNSTADDTSSLRISVVTDGTDDEEVRVTWSPADSVYVGIHQNTAAEHPTGTLFGKASGEQIVTVTAAAGARSVQKTIKATVSGIQRGKDLADKGVTVRENETVTVSPGKEALDYQLFGAAANFSEPEYTVEVLDNKPNVLASIQNGIISIRGVEMGTAQVRFTVSQKGDPIPSYNADFTVTVESNEQTISWTEGCSVSNPLKFSALETLIADKCKEITGEALASVVGLNVPTSQGILYLGYNSPEEPGAGVGGSATYYYNGSRGPYIRDITFVPNPSFAGERAEITFTGQTAPDGSGASHTFKGKIEVTLTDEKTDLTVSTKRNTPLPLTASMFSKICQEQVGSPLDYVIFTLPPASQGALYLDYKDEWSYAAKLSPNEKYDRRALDTVTFVPAETYVGEVRVSYAGYSVSGSKYNGELVIQVQQGLDDAITYNDNGSGSVSFSRLDFNDFCENATGKGLSSVSFTLPPAAQGVLYLSWNGSRGVAAAEGASYSPAQLDRMTFVAADGFHGVVRIPFSGASRSGLNFSGTVEIHIQSVGTSSTDASISYICAPGQSVKLNVSDFANLCQSLTGQKLHYINFQSLPDFNQGSLYHNRTSAGVMGNRATTATRYFNSAAPYISNLSFWATNRFTSVTVPFTGSSVNGQTFTGTMSISSGAGAGSGLTGAVNYSTVGQTPVHFSGGDFDAACREAANAALSYLQFGLPSSGQGILYYDYRAGTAPTALNAGTALYRSGETSVDRVSFVAAKGFSGVALVPFTGWAIDGRQFQGAVQITVRPDAALGGLVRYESRGEPVHINAYDIQTASGGVPASLRLTGLPDAGQGKLYYQYAGPTQYSWQGNTSTVYSLYGDPSVSNLTFVPKAGFYGAAEIPYTASNADGTQYTGAIRITVTEPSASANFDDLSGYPAQMKSAVDYLYSLGVVQGTGQRRYEPGSSIRRGDFCVMLSQAFRFNVGSSAQGFSDVPVDAYYAQAVNEMYAIGVVNGVGGGRFDPSSSLTRQDAALMVQRALNKAGIDVPNGNAAALAAYGDRGQVVQYAQGAVSGLVQMGLLPTSGSLLAPRDSLNRGDMALLLHRAMTQ